MKKTLCYGCVSKLVVSLKMGPFSNLQHTHLCKKIHVAPPPHPTPWDLRHVPQFLDKFRFFMLLHIGQILE